MRARYKTQWFLLALTLMVILTLEYILLHNKFSYDVGFFLKTTPSDLMSSTPRSLDKYRHVTKSLAELGKMDEISAHVIFLNRLPKSGSEILVLLVQWLQGWNNFRHVRLKGNKQTLSNLEQEDLVYKVYDTIRKEAVPMCFDRDIYFINFTRFDRQSPTYINLIRDPADYLISRFHHIKNKNRKSYGNMKDPKNVEECLLDRKPACNLYSGTAYDLAIPYFCGQDPRCSLLNDKWALQIAKSNVEKYYSVVGILEEVNTTLEVFENRLPYFFKGVQKLYYRDLLQPFHNNQKKLLKISETVRKYVKSMLKQEYEFYDWIKSRLFRQLQIIYGEHNAH